MPATSKINICNNALLRIGADIINALNEQSKEAEYCNKFYDEDRVEVLEQHPWNFAMKQTTLSKLAETPNDYSFVYTLPSDYVIARKIVDTANPENNQIKYEVRERKLYTDQDAAILEYTFDQGDTTAFSSAFSNALAWRLAADLAMPITNNIAVQEAMMRMYLGALSVGERNDARAQRKDTQVGQAFLNARK